MLLKVPFKEGSLALPRERSVGGNPHRNDVNRLDSSSCIRMKVGEGFLFFFPLFAAVEEGTDRTIMLIELMVLEEKPLRTRNQQTPPPKKNPMTSDQEEDIRG